MILQPYRTAIARRGPSFPVRRLQYLGALQGRVLDFGCGYGADARFLRTEGFSAHSYDSYEGFEAPLPKGKFDTVLMTYVLNVLPPKERRAALREAWSLVKPKGALIVASRTPAEIQRNAKNRLWHMAFDGFLSNHGTFQVGLSRTDLFWLLEDLRPRAEVEVVQLGSKVSAAMARRRR